MSRRIFFTLLSIFVSLPLLFSVPKVFAQLGNYNASGYVCDDLNANGRCEPNEPGIPGMLVYADNTLTGPRGYTDTYGFWQINNLPAGPHSIEIANAGSGGSKPTTSEKFLVSGPTSTIQFGIQKGGYGVDGYVTDPYGRAVPGAMVYVDLPNRQTGPNGQTTVITNGQGYYRFEDVGYDSSPVVYGVSGGHTINVEGYTTTPRVVNPQTTVPGIRVDMTVATDQSGPSCGPTYARDPLIPANCTYFPNRCILPAGWQEVGSCTITTPSFGGGGQCFQGQRVPNSGSQRCNNNQQSCMVYSYYSNSSCSTYQGQLEECQYVSGQCGYSQYSGYSGSTYGSTYTNSTWESGNGTTWYDQSTPYIAPDVGSSPNDQDWYY